MQYLQSHTHLLQVIKRSSAKKQEKKSKVKVRSVGDIVLASALLASRSPDEACSILTFSTVQTFIKVVNYQHLMPTRYTLEVDMKNLVTTEAVENSTKRKEARKVGSGWTAGTVLLQSMYGLRSSVH